MTTIYSAYPFGHLGMIPPTLIIPVTSRREVTIVQRTDTYHTSVVVHFTNLTLTIIVHVIYVIILPFYNHFQPLHPSVTIPSTSNIQLLYNHSYEGICTSSATITVLAVRSPSETRAAATLLWLRPGLQAPGSAAGGSWGWVEHDETLQPFFTLKHGSLWQFDIEINLLRVIPTMAFNSSHLAFCLANLLAFYLAFCLRSICHIV